MASPKSHTTTFFLVWHGRCFNMCRVVITGQIFLTSSCSHINIDDMGRCIFYTFVKNLEWEHSTLFFGSHYLQIFINMLCVQKWCLCFRRKIVNWDFDHCFCGQNPFFVILIIETIVRKIKYDTKYSSPFQNVSMKCLVSCLPMWTIYTQPRRHDLACSYLVCITTKLSISCSKNDY